MEKILRYCALICVFAMLAAAPVCAKVASKYEVVEITKNGLSSISVKGINNSGIVYGNAFQDTTHSWGTFRYNINTAVTEFTDQIALPTDINNYDVVSGMYYTRNGATEQCVWNADGSITDLPALHKIDSFDTRINDSGVVLGWLPDMRFGRVQNFVWTPESGLITPPLPSSSELWQIIDFNNTGYYLGREVTIDPIDSNPRPVDPFRCSIWSEDGVLAEITKDDFYPMFINDSNEVTGMMRVGNEGHIFKWNPISGSLDVVEGLGKSPLLIDFNNRGQILLESEDGFCLWDEEDGLVSVKNLIDPMSNLRYAYSTDINDDGWILSEAYNASKCQNENIVLRPVNTPEPSSLLLFTVGIIGIAGYSSRRRHS